MDPTIQRPRLCHLIKNPDFNGYGFNLHVEKGKAGQYIGKVDEGSPAEVAGLREGDRIVEVNGVNIGSENHQQVVERIKAVQNETKFLVVDEATDAHYREAKIVIHGELANVHHVDQLKDNKNKLSNGTSQDSDDHELRLCRLRIWSDYGGYGFNLHAEKGKSSQFIGKVDPNSPAEAAGMREGDRIIEVNGDSVVDLSHSEVVAKIKSDPKEVTMLLADPDTEKYYKDKGIAMTSSLKNVSKKVCPDVNPHTASKQSSEETHHPRLCHIKSRDDGKGFGFNMQADKTKIGQYIGKVDPDSPAESAGLRPGDRIIEVNGTNIEQDSHKEVVVKIKAIPDETTLLVVDAKADEYFKVKGVLVTSSLVAVKHSNVDADERRSVSSSDDSDDEKETKADVQEAMKTEYFDEKEAEKLKSDDDDDATPKVIGVIMVDRDGDYEVVDRIDKASEHGDDDRKSDHSDDRKSDHSEDRKSDHSDKSSEHSDEEPVTTGKYVLAQDEDHKESDSSDSDKEEEEKNEGDGAVLAVVVKSKDSDDEAQYSVVVKVQEVEVVSEPTKKTDEVVVETMERVILVHSMSAEEEVKATFEKIKAEVDAEHPKKAEAPHSLPQLSTNAKPREPEVPSPKSPVTINGIEFAATAEEARQKMNKKSRNSRATSMSIKDKYDLFQKL